MEGREPFDPEDELDFDFEAPRRRFKERTDEHALPGEPGTDPGAPSEPGTDPGADADRFADSYGTGEYGTGEQEDPFDTGERRRAERPRRGGGFKIPGLGGGRRRRPDTAEQRRAARQATGERAAVGSPDTGDEDVPAMDTAERRRLRDDPFTPAEVPVPGERRSRRRDLPAKVRRRQIFAAGGLAVLVLGGGYLVLAGGGGDDGGESELPLKRLVGQTVIGKLGPQPPDQKLLRRVRKGQLGGVIVEAPDEEALQANVAQLQKAAADGGNPPLLVMIDQEGGEVKRLPNGPPIASPADLGAAGDAEAARSEGDATGTFLKGLGVDVDLAPVLDVATPRTADTIADRTFGEDPAVVSELGSAFIEGMQAQGVAATAKHFPGMGLATVNTDFSPVTIAARQEDLDAALQPFQAAVDAGVQMVMVSSAVYPAYGGTTEKDPNRPAVFTKQVNQTLLRDQLGFGGVIITDDLQAIGITELVSPPVAGVSALGAGADLVLYARNAQGSAQAFANIVKAAKQERLPRAELQASYDRIQALKDSLRSD
jgi:beta-N-acetylhexosaminidase